MHSSRMRTVRCRSRLLERGGVCKGVGGVVCPGEVSAQGCASRGSVCFQRGWCFQGVCFRGVCFLGGCSQGVCASGGCIPACTEVDTPSRPRSLSMNTLEGFVTYTKRLPKVTLLINSFYEVSRVPTFLSCQIPWFPKSFPWFFTNFSQNILVKNVFILFKCGLSDISLCKCI